MTSLGNEIAEVLEQQIVPPNKKLFPCGCFRVEHGSGWQIGWSFEVNCEKHEREGVIDDPALWEGTGE